MAPQDDLYELYLNDRKNDRLKGFLQFLDKLPLGIFQRLWDEYKQAEALAQQKNEAVFKAVTFSTRTAKEGEPYSETVTLPDRDQAGKLDLTPLRVVDVRFGEELQDIGLSATVAADGRSFTFAGTPDLDGLRKLTGRQNLGNSEYEYTVRLRWAGELPGEGGERQQPCKAKLMVIQSPRKLWENKSVDWEHMSEPRYRSEDEAQEALCVPGDGKWPGLRILAASKRGRSHAQEAKPRDDNFLFRYMEESQWAVVAVADGAGSARFSREGSRIACHTVVERCAECLAPGGKLSDFETALKLWGQYARPNEEGEVNEADKTDAEKMVSQEVYNLLVTAAYEAQKAIIDEAADAAKNYPNDKITSRDYATTLLVAICKHLQEGWFFATFWVGDGALALYREGDGKPEVNLLGVPDGGDYAGQTRFLTMPEIFADSQDIARRLRFKIVPDFTALYLMSDGVADPWFETDANLLNPDKWREFHEQFAQPKDDQPRVDLSAASQEVSEELLRWLDFWSKGNHDDRTIAVLLPGGGVEATPEVIALGPAPAEETIPEAEPKPEAEPAPAEEGDGSLIPNP